MERKGRKDGGKERGRKGREGRKEGWREVREKEAIRRNGVRGKEVWKGGGGSRESDTKDVESSQILNVRPQQGGMQSPQTTICHPTHVYF